jgi:hypothetical protein
MRLNLEELAATRRTMVKAFDDEESSGFPYRSKTLSKVGLERFPELMRAALEDGDEETLAAELAKPRFWNEFEPYRRGGVERQRRVNVYQAAERLATTEFSTWYVRGLTERLLVEGVEFCQTYRAANPKWEPGECSQHEGQLLRVEEVHGGHRRRYWPEPGDPFALSVPFGPGCHHTVRRA